MKKIRIELLPGVKEKDIRFFDSVEALYENMCYGAAAENESFVVYIDEGDFLEVEWMGCENLFEEDGTWHKLSYVRMCRASQTKNASGIRVMPYIGWISETDLRFVDSIDDKCTKTVLTSPEHSRLDFSAVFKDSERDEAEPTPTHPSDDNDDEKNG